MSKVDRRRFLILVALRASIQLLDVAGLALVGGLGAALALAGTNSSATLLGFEISLTNPSVFLFAVSLAASFFIAKSAFGVFLLRVTTRFLAKIEAKMSMIVAKRIFGMDLATLKQSSQGEINWSFLQSSTIAFGGLLNATATFFSELTLFISIFVLILATDPISGSLLAIYFGSVLLFFQLIINRRLRAIGERLSRNGVEIIDTMQDFVRAFREIVVLGGRGRMVAHLGDLRFDQAAANASHRFLQSVPRYFVEASLILGILGLMVWQFLRGDLVAGLASVAIMATGGIRMMGALLPLQNSFASIRGLGPQALKAHTIIRDALTFQPDEVSTQKVGTDIELPDGVGVRIQDLKFRYPGEGKSLDFEISRLDFPAGKVTAIVGKSGAGKSTLLELVLGLLSSDGSAGSIQIGSKITGGDGSRNGLAYVPQKPGLVRGSILDNITLFDLDPDPSRINRACSLAELQGVLAELPDGLDTLVGPQADGLSGGQIQRIGLARALYSEPKLLVLDEATSGLDTETEALVNTNLRSLLPDTTVIISAHRPNVIRSADYLVFIHRGRLSGSGTLAELKASSTEFREFSSSWGP